ncbi:MAG: aminodeoxychorismate lyase [Gordonia sp. (in: high G+C Gram-positive bacteria)]|uniref:aminodeoxychorismate lyase n=1 Tax=Gordonia sp. (in: high G+C Gram-positive bacteria) TaxID=84139 RepID=UPI0039E613DD
MWESEPVTMMVVSARGQVLDPQQPLLHADDLGVLHGDGLFETLLVRDGRPRLLERHLERLALGAQTAGLPAPDIDGLRAAALTAAGEWSSRGDGDGMARIVYTRGRESVPGVPTAYVTVGPVGAGVAGARRDGLDVITLATGRRGDAPAWELTGVKSLSYARNAAAARYARERGAGEALFLSTDGAVLEGTRSNVVVVTGRTLVTPPADGGILPGITVAAVFDQAAAAGLAVRADRVTVADLTAADAVWLLSSVTLAAPVRSLDGTPLDRGGIDVAALADQAIG